MRKSYLLLLISASWFLQGCAGISMPQPFEHQPYTILKGGDQFGRDQLANRMLVSNAHALLKGMGPNDVLSFLGQPQNVKVTERNVSESWYYVYYKKYKLAPHTPEGAFLVQFYEDKVIDVVSLK